MWQGNKRVIMIYSVICCCASVMLQWMLKQRCAEVEKGDWKLHIYRQHAVSKADVFLDLINETITKKMFISLSLSAPVSCILF